MVVTVGVAVTEAVTAAVTKAVTAEVSAGVTVAVTAAATAAVTAAATVAVTAAVTVVVTAHGGDDASTGRLALLSAQRLAAVADGLAFGGGVRGPGQGIARPFQRVALAAAGPRQGRETAMRARPTPSTRARAIGGRAHWADDAGGR